MNKCLSSYWKHSSKDLNTTIDLKNRGRIIKAPLISWHVIMNFNFGYVYITTYRLKVYVYILEIVLVLIWQTPFFLKCLSPGVWHWRAGWNALRIGTLGSINCNLTNTLSTPPPEVKNNSIIVNYIILSTWNESLFYTFFYKQSIFDPRPENCWSFSKKSPLFSNCLVDGLLTSIF